MRLGRSFICSHSYLILLYPRPPTVLCNRHGSPHDPTINSISVGCPLEKVCFASSIIKLCLYKLSCQPLRNALMRSQQTAVPKQNAFGLKLLNHHPSLHPRKQKHLKSCLPPYRLLSLSLDPRTPHLSNNLLRQVPVLLPLRQLLHLQHQPHRVHLPGSRARTLAK